MKKTLTLLLIFAFSIHLHAQTFTYSNFAQSLTVTPNVLLANNASFNTGLVSIIGNGVTWDASGLTPMAGYPTIHLGFGNPASTPYASTYPNSNYVLYDPALVAVIDYEYVQINNDSMVVWGTYGATGKHEVYQNPDKRLVFPFAYNQSFTDDYYKTNYSDATTISSYQSGVRTVTFIGYGTLKLPQGTFTDVALISELRTNSLGPNSTSFTWYQVSDGKRLLLASENNGNVSVAYTSDNSVGVTKLTSNGTPVLFPNPAASTSVLKIQATNMLNETVFSLTDVTGRLIHTYNVVNNEVYLNEHPLSSGVYYFRVSNSNSVLSSGTVVIQ